MIKNMRDLANEMGVATHPYNKVDLLTERIARRLFKYTDCGISFHHEKGSRTVTVSGYCEGVDAECESHVLTFPFTKEQWEQAVSQADKDGCDMWDETHGCPACETDEIDGYKPIDPKCKACEGRGQIM